jgi:hypothetical protein
MNSLPAEEQVLAILKSVDSNALQKFSLGRHNFECKPYGLVTLENLYQASPVDSKCRKEIEQFYTLYPNTKFFTSNMLKLMQMYHLEFKDKECILYAYGQKILSEFLLAEGLAFMKAEFQDEEFQAIFYKAQTNANASKIGVWTENILNNCVVETYKE